ncbi:hypothetical protein AMELA_G00143930 [Ameiurus melas]|uniref:Uncharacterized protein n=1 Tax=Ameiurus melas TaxID=219545 RepID=A0A7J6AL77_AMEME|nr:hypothetical protein AMELA_G00143930 [Ameiurus melas]
MQILWCVPVYYSGLSLFHLVGIMTRTAKHTRLWLMDFVPGFLCIFFHVLHLLVYMLHFHICCKLLFLPTKIQPCVIEGGNSTFCMPVPIRDNANRTLVLISVKTFFMSFVGPFRHVLL